MPKGTTRTKARNGNVDVKFCTVPNKSTTTKIPKNDTRKEKCIVKKEFVVDTAKGPATEEVFHRKSERRRVARDIFLVFEEESNNRRTRGSSKKQTKPKFGHLKVEDPIRTKSLLRDVKNEPRCYINGSNLNVNSATELVVPVNLKSNTNKPPICKEQKNLKERKKKSVACKTVNSVFYKKSNSVGSIQISTSTEQSQSCILDNEQRLVARVNPIFLWVKQDDTRIVEVRCEDYDKRNRIRITKTSNGWRAIPRSDPTSSRVLKFYPTPLMKVKRENQIQETNNNSISTRIENKESIVCNDYATQNVLTENISNKITTKLKRNDVLGNAQATEHAESKTKKSKRLKKKSHSEKSHKRCKSKVTAIQDLILNSESLTPLNPHLNKNSPNNRAEIEYTITSVRFECKTNNKQQSEKCMSPKNETENIQIDNLENESPSINPYLMIEVPSETESTYQKKHENEFPFHLCPKTGLFLPNNQSSILECEVESFENENMQNVSSDVKNYFLNINKEEIVNIELEKNNAESKIQISDENPESLDAKTKNLKDLLDDADLLQHCDENANSDADLIDTLVKTSCENNLIQANEIITTATEDQSQQKMMNLQGDTNEMVVQLITDVSDSPKCLSFNEAGEIEGLNGEIFHSNTYMETFEKQESSLLAAEAQITLHSTTSAVATSASPQRPSTCENLAPIMEIMDINNSIIQSVSVVEDSPKDLSYKKREEVCTPSDSRSQCAVTSSSDVIKSPQREDTSSLTSSSETLKNIILEQFMKLNALSSQQYQRDPIDLGTQRHQDMSNIKSLYTSTKSGQSSDFIETVVIEDDDDNGGNEEPLKKRLKLNKPNITQNIGKIALIDKDPDPLTQLRLLIRNTQWKVPDPILVPKDRLSAVLASPAREIPLLITTRPELRLPEAFAYPEIIQNPNILVISMAQLEAILKNELEVEKTSSSKIIHLEVNKELCEQQVDVQLPNQVNELQTESSRQLLQHPLQQQPANISSSNSISQVPNDIVADINNDTTSQSLLNTRKENAKYSQTNSCLSSEINSATMAVLNQMLWLPYFGQISQDILKSIKTQDKCPNLVPIFNSHLTSLTNLEDIYKNTTNKKSGQSVANTGFHQQNESDDELLLFQKIIQHQMQSVLQLNHLKTVSSQIKASTISDNAVSSMDKSNSNIASSSTTNFIDPRKKKVILPNNKQRNSSSSYKSQTNNDDFSNTTSVTEKSYNLRSSVAGRHSIAESKQYANSNQKQNIDNKPRLTCKSLSNLLDPEHSMVPSSSNSSIPHVHKLTSNFLKTVSEGKRSSTDCKVSDRNSEGKGTSISDGMTIVPPHTRPCDVGNITIESSSIAELSKDKSKIFVDSVASENNRANNDASGLSADSNIPLWHPLFGSNTKTVYNSPWQWTTVTATGE